MLPVLTALVVRGVGRRRGAPVPRVPGEPAREPPRPHARPRGSDRRGARAACIAIDRLVESDDERDVRLGLDILTIAQHPELPARLQRLVVDDRVNVRTDALERLVRLAPEMAAAAARDCLDDPSPDVRAASIRVLGAAGSPATSRASRRARATRAAGRKVAVAFALTRIGDDAVAAPVAATSRASPGRTRPATASVAASCWASATSGAGSIEHCSAPSSPTGHDRVVDAALAALHGPRTPTCSPSRPTSTIGGPPARPSTRSSAPATPRSSSSTTACGARHRPSRAGVARARRPRDRRTVGGRGAPPARRAPRP